MSDRALAVLALCYYCAAGALLWHEGMRDVAAWAFVAAPFAVILALRP